MVHYSGYNFEGSSNSINKQKERPNNEQVLFIV